MRIAVGRTFLLSFVLLVAHVAAAGAAPVLGGSVTITFTGDFGLGPGSINETDVVTVGAGPEITFGDGSNIGGNVLLDFETLDLGGLTITYTIQGGNNPGVVVPGYGDSGIVEGAFTFSNLQFSPTATIVGISTVLTNVIDPNNAAAGFTFTGNSLTMSGLEQFLIALSTENTGTIAVTLQVDDGTTGPPAPEPAAVTLLGTAIVLIARRRWQAGV